VESSLKLISLGNICWGQFFSIKWGLAWRYFQFIGKDSFVQVNLEHRKAPKLYKLAAQNQTYIQIS
jgi:hypothetical protein